MATRRVGRGCWDGSPTERRPPARLREPAGKAEAASPPVLSLSHFCTKPFLCFGDVRLGASRTLSLAVYNPNAEEAAVTLPRCPAADRGFSVWPRAFVLQPKEKIVISVNWAPLKQGRVREIVTFLVNDVVKHEVILLGNADAPKKKKRSLWDTINKKTVSASSGHEKRISNIQNVNQTFNVSQKVDKVRSPLQACENLAGNASCSPTENNSLILEENKIPISPISPIFKECHGETCLPLSVRRSTTYTSLHAPENRELLQLEGANISKDFDFNEKVITETSFDSMNNINGQIEEDNKLILTPNYSSTLNITQSQGNFLSPDSFVKNSHKANNELELVTCISPDTFINNNSRPVHLESKPVHEIYRTILSPDSFIKDNYGLKKDLESELINPNLSPHQFVKDNMAYICISQQTCNLSPLSNENSQASQPPQRQRKNEVSPCVPECRGSKSPKAIFEEPKALEMKANCDSFTKPNQPKFSAVQDCSGCSHNTQPQKRPILSATVTKLKPTCARESQTEINRPKAKRCLHSVAGECEKVADDQEEKNTLHAYLPVIDPVGSKSKSCKMVVSPPSKTAPVVRKRKNEGNREDGNVMLTVTEHTEVQKIKRIHFSPVEVKTSAVKKTKKVITPTSKLISNREKLNLKKKTESLVYKTPNSKTSKRTKRLVPVAQSNLTFLKPLKTDIPRHPMPFAAKNMFYDERWKEKQQQGFTWWLNFILTPDDFTVKTNVSEVNAATLLLGVESQHKLSVPRAPTKDEMSLRAYTARCRLNRLRRAACCLFTSEKMVKAIKKLEIEIEARRLIVRKDRHLWKDVGERQKVLNWLMSYNPLWLRIGLETVYGELIALEDNSDVTGLALFILNRLLWNPDIAAEFRHPTVPHLYRDGHEEALSRFTLKKLLLLVCFLDYAKISRLIDHDPCLFCKDAEFKASKEILLAFSRDFLSGEGDLSRHLSLLGLPVNHVQTPFDEFDFAVTNLAVDLQCGVRLVRAMELLTQSWDLSKRLRVPAISRLQKVHNVDLVLQVLRARGIQLNDEYGSPILSKDIVDRHREKTLALLWKIAFAFQVDISLNLDQLKEEIDFLKLTWSMKKTMSALSCHSDTVLNKKKDRRLSNPFEQYSESIKLLMEWVNAVCAFYNKKVENFTVSFSDGRVLCYLIHHYHPCYVPFASICQRTTQTVECAQTGSVVLNSSSESDESCLDMSLKALDHENTSELCKELLENEKKNFQLVRSAVRDLGGIPAMIHHSDMSNTIPDEKVVITYLSFLCARLLDLRRETRAARLIQTTWRKFKLKHHQERDKAAIIIQSAVINFLTKQRLKKKVNAALVIQKYWRRLLEQRKLLMLKKENLEKAQNKSALIIQKYWRRYSTRKKFLKLKHYSVILQSRIRMIIAVASYKRYLWATVTIQRHWLACLRRKQDQQRYKKLKSSTLIIQSLFRRWKQHKMQLQIKATIILQRAFRQWHARKRSKEEKSAVVIQSWYRMHKELRKYSHIRSCIVIIQTRFRCFQARKLYRRKKESVLTIQRYYQAYLKGKTEHTKYLQKRATVVQLQAAFRGMKARHLHRQIRAACVLQSYWRMRQERFRFLNLKKIIIKLQAHVRKYQQVQKYKKMKKATLVIQIHFRAYVSAKKVLASYQKTHSAVIVLQSAYRGMQARKKFNHILRSIVKIQSYYRAYISRKKFLSLKHATVKLQSIVKMKKTRKQYLHIRAAALFIQKWYRSITYRASAIIIQRWYRNIKIASHQRKEYLNLKKTAVKIQAMYRGVRIRRHIQHMHMAATFIKAMFKMHQAKIRYQKMRTAALIIQVRYRAYYQGKTQRAKYLAVLKAVNILQASFRGARVRQTLSKMQTAATLIQSYYRRYRQQSRFNKLKKVTKTLQQRYRAMKARNVQFQRYNKLRRSVICIQAVFRGMKARRHLKVMHLAATLIQRRFRTLMMRRRFLSLRKTALWAQRQYRANVCAKHHLQFLRLQRAVIKIQSSCRRWIVRRKIREMHRAAALIQATISTGENLEVVVKNQPLTPARVGLNPSPAAACRLLSLSLLHFQHLPQEYEKTTSAVYDVENCVDTLLELLQMYREKPGDKVADKSGSIFTKTCCLLAVLLKTTSRASRHRAACSVQAHFRGCKARQLPRRQESAAATVRRDVRAGTSGKSERTTFFELKKSTVALQALVRGWLVRKRISEQRARTRLLHFTAAAYYHLSALRIQRAYRRHMAVKNAERHVNSVICIQGFALPPSTPPSELSVQCNRGEVKYPVCLRTESKGVCASPPLITNGVIIGSAGGTYENGSSVEYRCFDHHFLQGPRVSHCVQGVWTTPPLCLEEKEKTACEEPPAVGHGAANLYATVYYNGDKVAFTCQSGYHLRGPKEITCTHGKWTLPPECVGHALCLLSFLTPFSFLNQLWRTPHQHVYRGYVSRESRAIRDAREISRDVRNRSKVVDHVYSLHKLTARKHRMSTERALHKQNKNSSISSPFIPETPVRTRVVSRLKPGWVLRKDNMEITSPLQAIRMVMDTLGIPY
ncbi:PREDICTED: abnormal spindle-like microcephaly-associated protein [Hipposideros armiger]|uniref:Abnormal spindle-like microcephaly-associated protein homolog n=1 Tax=Hipposideros armiger TaxID=186990 RepID=A0A8B7R0P9_HIPAR|nr:PREDICTED: abnormal spindle-like microcephaly-associated protein [Hipposideros armiger]